jgi:hypothetical protein
MHWNKASQQGRRRAPRQRLRPGPASGKSHRRARHAQGRAFQSGRKVSADPAVKGRSTGSTRGVSPLYRLRKLGPEKVAELAQSMERTGLLQPIVVQQAAIGYGLIAGYHRLEAARKLGWLETCQRLGGGAEQKKSPSSAPGLPRATAKPRISQSRTCQRGDVTQVHVEQRGLPRIPDRPARRKRRRTADGGRSYGEGTPARA